MRTEFSFFAILFAATGCSSSPAPSEGAPGQDLAATDASMSMEAATPGSGESGSDASAGPDTTETADAGTTPELDASSKASADASDAGPYNPCPAAGTPCRIMPLGDSITYGYQSTTMGGYRSLMFDYAVKAHRSITFVGSQTSGPSTVDGMPFPQENEGHTGYTIDDDPADNRMGIQQLAESAIQTYHPDIVTLMIGTNDVDLQVDLANAPTRLGTLLDTILAADPHLLLVVAQITPTQDDTENTRVQAYNAGIPALVAARASAGKHILMVDMYGALTKNPSYQTAYLANPLHPNDDGFKVVAGVWEAAIGELFR